MHTREFRRRTCSFWETLMLYARKRRSFSGKSRCSQSFIRGPELASETLTTKTKMTSWWILAMLSSKSWSLREILTKWKCRFSTWSSSSKKLSSVSKCFTRWSSNAWCNANKWQQSKCNCNKMISNSYKNKSLKVLWIHNKFKKQTNNQLRQKSQWMQVKRVSNKKRVRPKIWLPQPLKQTKQLLKRRFVNQRVKWQKEILPLPKIKKCERFNNFFTQL